MLIWNQNVAVAGRLAPGNVTTAEIEKPPARPCGVMTKARCHLESATSVVPSLVRIEVQSRDPDADDALTGAVLELLEREVAPPS